VRSGRRLGESGLPGPEALERLGGGWVGEEALAIAVNCAIGAPEFHDGVLAAANVDGGVRVRLRATQGPTGDAQHCRGRSPSHHDRRPSARRRRTGGGSRRRVPPYSTMSPARRCSAAMTMSEPHSASIRGTRDEGPVHLIGLCIIVRHLGWTTHGDSVTNRSSASGPPPPPGVNVMALRSRCLQRSTFSGSTTTSKSTRSRALSTQPTHRLNRTVIAPTRLAAITICPGATGQGLPWRPPRRPAIVRSDRRAEMCAPGNGFENAFVPPDLAHYPA
jgi:hypothetical protein